MADDERTSQYEDFLAGIDRMKEVEREQQFLDGIIEHCAADDLARLGPVGERIRCFREAQGLTLGDMTSRTGYEEEYLARIEDADVSPPLGVLIKLGKALDTKLGVFISGGENRAYTIVRKDERQKISRRAKSKDEAYGYTYQSLAPGKTDRRMEPFLVTLEPSEDVELSSHDGQEFIFVLEGRMEAIIGDDRQVLDAGDTIYYDSNVPHMVRCMDGPETRILAVLYAGDK